MNDAVAAARAHVARIGALLFDRHLTDAAGGNVSERVGDVICLSPRFSGSKHQWQITPEQVLVVDLDGNKLEGDGELSRESKVHLRLHRQFGEYGTGVIHAHPRNMMVFVALARPMPPVLEANLKFGEIKVVPYAPAHSARLAESIAETLRGQEKRISKHAAGIIAPWHGIFVMGKDLDATFDAVERFDTNAYCITMAQGLGDNLAAQRAALDAAIAAYEAENA